MLKKYMPLMVKHVVKVLLGKEPAGRMMSVRNTDVFIVSYPKSGNTWTRFLIGNLIYEDGVNFSNIEARIPDIYVNSDRFIRKMEHPRILKSHEFFDPRYKKVIYIVRDPRDVAVSYWHFVRKQNKLMSAISIDEFIDLFIHGGMDPFGTWSEHAGGWLGAREKDKGFLLLRYEDLLNSPKEGLIEIASFLDISISNDRIEKAVLLSSFDRMKEMEKKQYQEWKPIRNSSQDIPFIRSGKQGQWQSLLSRNAVSLIQNTWGTTMNKFGYTI